MSLIDSCYQLIQAYHDGLLGNMVMPEDVHPDFEGNKEKRLVFFTLPMALNYQRNSYKLREAATQTYQDSSTSWVFDIAQFSQLDLLHIQQALVKHKVALQPNKHTATRNKIAQTITTNR